MRARSGRFLSEVVCEDSVSQLPEFAQGWEKVDNPDGGPYYYNANTQVSQWDPPWKLPPDWTEHTNDADGKPYFHNSETGATIWERPSGLQLRSLHF